MSKSLKALESLISTHINIQNGTNMIFNTSKILGELNLIKQDLERLEELKQRWGKEEWCQGIPLSAESLKSLFNYNEELFNKNLELDKENQELKERLSKYE